MLIFATFPIAAAFYLTFIIWLLLAPLATTRSKAVKIGRVSLGIVLLVATQLPILALPLTLTAAALNRSLGDFTTAVVLFPWTLPDYVNNLRSREGGYALLVEVVYPIKIGDVSYRPTVHIVCTTRRMIDLDMGVVIHRWTDMPTVVGAQFAGALDNIAITFNHVNLCYRGWAGELTAGDVLKSEVLEAPRFKIIHTVDDTIRTYEVTVGEQPVSIDAFRFDLPIVTRLQRRPAAEIVPVGALWPMRYEGSSGRALTIPGPLYGCISSTEVSWSGVVKRRDRMTAREREQCRKAVPLYRPAAGLRVVESSS